MIHKTDHDAVAYATYWLGLHDPDELVQDVRSFSATPLCPDADCYLRMRECVGMRCSDPAPGGHVLPPVAGRRCTGYRGGIGYGWCSYVAGEAVAATVLDYIRGRTVSAAVAAQLAATQKDRQDASDAAFLAYLRA